jgi:hypothetical protein
MHPPFDVIKIQFSCDDDGLSMFILGNLMQTYVPPATACLHTQFQVPILACVRAQFVAENMQI